MEYNMASNLSFNGILIIDNQGIIREINQSAKSIFMLSDDDEYIGKDISTVIHHEQLLRDIRNGNVIESKIIEMNHTIFVYDVAPFHFDGNNAGTIVVVQDITLQELIFSATNTFFDFIITTDNKGVIEFANSEACRRLRMRPSEVVGRLYNELFPKSPINEIIETRQPINSIGECNGDYAPLIRTPLFRKEQMIGILIKSVFNGMDQARNFVSRINYLEDEIKYYKNELKNERVTKYTFDNYIGSSDIVKNLVRDAKIAAKVKSSILILGESGTGKEIIAQAIHNNSQRQYKNFVKINSSAIPENLLESELFGYTDGSFTGSKKGGKVGKFEIANGGTIFLDEVGDLPLAMQPKLLRVLQEGEIEKIGATKAIKVDVRVIAATNHNLEEWVKSGLFREDLYYRLNVITLHTPALREHKDDLLLISNELIVRLSRLLGKPVQGLSRKAELLLMAYDWPGNVRQLENMLERAISFSTKTHLYPEDFPQLHKLSVQNLYGNNVRPLHQAIAELEEYAIKNALQVTNNKIGLAADLLQLNRSVLYRKMKKYNIH